MINIHWTIIPALALVVWGVWLFFIRKEPYNGGTYNWDLDGAIQGVLWFFCVILAAVIYGGMYWW